MLREKNSFPISCFFCVRFDFFPIRNTHTSILFLYMLSTDTGGEKRYQGSPWPTKKTSAKKSISIKDKY